MSAQALEVPTVDPNPSPSRPQASKTYDIETEPILTFPHGLKLRHHRHSDAANLSKHGDNPRITVNMTKRWPAPYTIDRAHDFITARRQETEWRAIGPTDPNSDNTLGLGQKLPLAWAITLNDEFIGSLNLNFFDNVFARTVSFGYWMAEEHWGKGWMSLILPVWLDWVWETYPWIVKMEPAAYAWNPASWRLLEKCGFELEGVRRCAFERMGLLGDLKIYGMIRPGVESSKSAPSADAVGKS